MVNRIVAHLNGKVVRYDENTIFRIEVSKSPTEKSGYRLKYSTIGDLDQAVRWYNSVNIGNGYKKRLVMLLLGQPPKTLTRHFSY